jgi:type IV pilus assembly protein PilO
MNSLLEQFRNLNFKDPGTWPVLPKLILLSGLLVAILVGAFVGDWQGQLDEVEAGRNQETQLKDDYVKKKQTAISLDLYRQQLREIDSSFGALLKQLPNRSQMDALLVDINQAGLGRGLNFDLFKPAAAETTRDFYAELPIQLKITGGYHDMGQFASDIGSLSRIVTLNDLDVRVDGKGNLSLDAVAKTFRYLDDTEVADQRRAAAKAGKAAKK